MDPEIRLRPFKEQVAYFIENNYGRGSSLWMGNTPPCLRMLGLPELPLRMTAGVLLKIYTGKNGEREGVPQGTIARLPELLDEPMAIFASSTKAGALVVLTTASNNSGVIVASLDASCRDGNTEVNMVTSAYSKGRNAWIAEQVAAGRLMYADEEKGFNTLEVSGHTLNCEAEPSSRNPSERKILLPDDLRNYRTELRNKKLGPLSP